MKQFFYCLGDIIEADEKFVPCQYCQNVSQGAQLPFKMSFEIEACDRDQVEQFAIEYLRERGFIVEKPREWETPGACAKRLGVSRKHVSAQLRHPARPHIDTDRGPSGRVLRIASNSLFDAFVTRNSKETSE